MTSVPFMPIARGLLGLAAIVGLAMFFKPLLIGIARALMLMVRPRLTREQKTARRQMRDAQLLQRMINSSDCPSHAAELRALGARA